ncbi:protein fiber 2 [Pigeon adenovirus 2]|uniref:Protein fiber 2 n=1 Tax=Pigeon adenovirus 2 TaxID=1907767 RepID=A0A1D8QM96_9ADEN|nr:protein fiber 2 [Pigeon adenovirus 2]AOW42063.1 protein fiber 2 [Pigeon adenovirus 2]
MLKRRNELSDDRKRKRPRAVGSSDSINLNYPFWYSAEENTEIVPPFIDPSGPLYDQDGKLNIRLTSPIALISNGVGLGYDSSLENVNNRLGVRIDSDGALEVTPDGLNVRVDDETVGINPSWELAVQFADEQPFSTSTAGIGLNVDDTLLISSSDSDPSHYELGVHLNTEGPITADENGIDLDFNPHTLTVQTNEQNQGILSVFLKANGGLGATESGIGVNYDEQSLHLDSGNDLAVRFAPEQPFTVTPQGITLNIDPSSLQVQNGTLSALTSGLGLDIDNNTLQVDTVNNKETLSVRIAPDNPVEADSSGIKLLYNTGDFFDNGQSGLSAVTPISYLSPYCYYEAGDSSLTDYSSTVRSSGNTNWPIAAYVKVANCSGVCNGVLNFVLNRNNITFLGTTNDSNNNYVKFCFVLNPGGNLDGIHSYVHNNIYFPAGANTPTFMAPTRTPPPNQTIPANWANWFVAKWVGVRVRFYATDSSGNQAIESYVHYYPALVNGSSGYPVIFFVFEIRLPSGQNWYTGSGLSTDYEILNSGPIPFQYLATKPSYTAVSQ